MYDQMSLLDLPSATSLPALESGALPFAPAASRTITAYGPDHALANLSARQELEPEKATNDTCGQPSPDSLKPDDLQLSLANKLPANSLPGSESLRICSDCGSEKPDSEFSLTGWKKTYRSLCKVCRNKAARELHQMRKGSTSSRASQLVAGAKSRAAMKGLPFDLTVSWVQKALDSGVCDATGIPFDMATKRGWNTPSLDQTQAGKGYTLQNTRVVLFGLNAACGTWGENRVIEMANAIMKRRRERSNELQKRLTENLKRKTAELGSTLYNLTWKEWTTPSAVSRSRLRASVGRTSVTGSTGAPSLPVSPRVTPAARDYKDSEGMATTGTNPDGSMRSRLDQLPRQASLASWATPRAEDSESAGMRHSRGVADTLTAQAMQLAGWPSPGANDTTGAEQREQREQRAAGGLMLRDIPHLLTGWPTPTVAEAAHAGRQFRGLTTAAGVKIQLGLSEVASMAGPARLTASGELLTGSTAAMASGGQLNPEHSRWLMGCPEAWATCHPNYSDWRAWQDFLRLHSSAPNSSESEACGDTATP